MKCCCHCSSQTSAQTIRLPPHSDSFGRIIDDKPQQLRYWHCQQNMEPTEDATNTVPYQPPVMNAEPGVGLPDLTEAYRHPLVYRSRQSSAIVEEWLTSESPVARATSFSSHQLPQDPHRLPSLCVQTTIPDVPPYQQAQFYYHPNQPTAEPSQIYSGPPPPQHLENHDQSPPHHLHLSELQHITEQNLHGSLPWDDGPYPPPGSTTVWGLGHEYMHSRCSAPPLSPYSSSSVPYSSGPYTEYCSSPEPYAPVLGARIPRSRPSDEYDIEEADGPSTGKPYAQLIQECLLQAPGHRMMLRDIYDWFEANTTKPLESGGTGWQNSIRHNLSMNKVRAVPFP
jgi:hypothetical protein